MEATDWQTIVRQNHPRYRSARRRSHWAMLFIGLATAAIALEILVVARGFSFVEHFGSVTLAEITTWERNLNTVSGLYIASIVPAAIAFLAWQSRVVDNIPALSSTDPWVTPRWSIALWFVPLASFVAPYRIVADAWRRLAGRPAQRNAGLVLIWWILWLGGGLTNRIVQAFTQPPETAPALSSLLTWITGAAVAQVVAGLLLVWIIVEIERRSADRAAANARSDLESPPADLAMETPAIEPRAIEPSAD
ncbi:MAG TPA: DUF4328 domain-containing protein [Candidatus Limnocylindrales bacterium]|nr:DUF4328 domain-containing protein [Candidatus Limnocylindrales bacterium]